MTQSHAMLAPSLAPVWARCAAAPMLALQAPEDESQEARDGTAAHWVAASILRGRGSLTETFVGRSDPDGTIITQEIYDSAEVFVQEVSSTLSATGQWDRLHIEHPIRATRIHQEVWGTLDAGWYDGTRLIIWDFKHGHAEVSPVWNEQLLCYAAGLMDYYNIDGLQDQKVTVELRIVQPRCYSAAGPVRGFQFVASDMRPRVNQLSAAAHAAWSGEGKTAPGPHCRYCPARGLCPAQKQVSMFGADYVHQAIPEPLTLEALSFELQVLDWLLPQLDARRDALAVDAMARINRGEFLPGYVLEPGQGRRRFSLADADVIDFGKALGVDLSQATKPVTVAEAERRIKNAGFDPGSMLSSVVETPATERKLKPASSSEAVRVFSYKP